MDIGAAMNALRQGARVSREVYNVLDAWDGNHLVFVPESSFVSGGRTLRYEAHIDFVSVMGTVEPWQPSQDALLAGDWYILQDPDRERGEAWHYTITPIGAAGGPPS